MTQSKGGEHKKLMKFSWENLEVKNVHSLSVFAACEKGYKIMSIAEVMVIENGKLLKNEDIQNTEGVSI